MIISFRDHHHKPLSGLSAGSVSIVILMARYDHLFQRSSSQASKWSICWLCVYRYPDGSL